MSDSSAATGGSEEDLKHYQGPAGLVARWLKEISLVRESNKQKTYEAIGERILGRFRNASATDTFSPTSKGKLGFPILWSNVQVLEPALFSRVPKAVAERIFKDSDPVGRLAAKGAERATQFQLDTQKHRFEYVGRAIVQDRLLPGRGVGCLQFSAEFEEAKDENGEPILDEQGQAIKTPKPNSEKVELHHVNWLDYLESPARTQYEVRWRATRIYKTRAELISELGKELGSAVSLSTGSLSSKKKKGQDEQEFLQQAEIWVIQDLTTKQVLWISEGYKDGPLKQLKDPLHLKDFWNCPLPLVATTTTESTYPTADYVIYEGLAEELDHVTKRLKAMVECIRVVGVIASQFAKKVKNMTDQADGTLQPVDGWTVFAEKGGLKGIIDWMPFDACVAAIPVLTQYQASLKSQIDEINSITELIRGSSDPNKPVYTQQQESHWVVVKLVRKQQDVQRWWEEAISKMAQIIFEPGLFSDETIYLMAGVAQMTPEEQDLWPQALALLRDDRLVTFRVGIATDSTIAIDEQQAMARWMQYLSAVKDIVGEVQQVSQYRPELMKPIVQSALDAVRSLRMGRNSEGAWERAFDEIEANDKAAAEKASQSPPPPDYEMMKAQNEGAKTQVAQMKAQTEQVKAQVLQQNSQFEQWEKAQRLELDSFAAQSEATLQDQANQIAAGQAMSRTEIDKMAHDIKVFAERFKQALEAQRFEFEKASKGLEMEEKLMEEKRLGRQDSIEAFKATSRHQVEMKKASQRPAARAT